MLGDLDDHPARRATNGLQVLGDVEVNVALGVMAQLLVSQRSNTGMRKLVVAVGVECYQTGGDRGPQNGGRFGVQLFGDRTDRFGIELLAETSTQCQEVSGSNG